MLYDVLFAIIGAYAIAWAILKIVHYFDHRSAVQMRAELEKKIIARGQTVAQWEREMEALRFESKCDREWKANH